MSKSPPDGTPQIIPYLYYEDAGPAIEFLEAAFTPRCALDPV